MKLQKLLPLLERFAPVFLAETWDKVGLQISYGTEAEVRKILCCLDVTPKVLQRVKEEKIDMVLSHHPLFFQRLQGLSCENGVEEAILSLIKENVLYYASHTNLDATLLGVGDALAQQLNLGNLEDVVAPLSKEKNERYLEIQKNRTDIEIQAFKKLQEKFPFFKKIEHLCLGFGRIVGLEESKTALEVLEQLAYNCLPSGIHRNFSKTEAKEHLVHRIAFCNGAFDETWISLLKEKQVNFLVTGEIKFHVLVELKKQKIFTAVLGHGTSEIYGMRLWKEYLQALDPQLEVEVEEAEHIYSNEE